MASAKVHRVKVYEYSPESGDKFIKDLHFAWEYEAKRHIEFLRDFDLNGVYVGLVTLLTHVKE